MKKYAILVLLIHSCVAAGTTTIISCRDLQKRFSSMIIAPKQARPTARFRDEQEKKRRAQAKQKKWRIPKGFYRKNSSLVIAKPNFYYPR